MDEVSSTEGIPIYFKETLAVPVRSDVINYLYSAGDANILQTLENEVLVVDLKTLTCN